MESIKYAILGIIFFTSYLLLGAEIGTPNSSAPSGGTLYFNLVGEPNTLHPISAMDLYSRRTFELTMDTLANFNYTENKLEPHLAERWEISKDNNEFTFFLRKNAKFHDGHEVTAEDVKFSFDVIFDPKFEGQHLRSYYENIEKVIVVDKHTVRFIVKTPYFKNFTQVATIDVLPKHIYGEGNASKKMTRKIVGAGPYKLEQFEKGDKMVFRRFDKWYGFEENHFKGLYNFEKLIAKFVKDETLSMEMLKKGELDFTTFRAEGYELKAIGEPWGDKILKVKYQNKEPKTWYFYGWNFKNPIFKSKKVRLALTQLMEREAMIKKFLFGYAVPAAAPISFQNESAPVGLKPVSFDSKNATKLLKEDGWEDTDKDGILDKIIDGKKVDFKFTLIHPNKDYEKFHTWYQEELKKAGIDMEITLLEWSAFEPLVRKSQFDAVAMGWGGGDQDPDPKQVWHSQSSNGGSNFINYNNPEVDTLIDKARLEMDRDKRIKLIRSVYEKIAADVPYTWWFNGTHEFYGVKATVQRPADALLFKQGYTSWWISP